MGCSTGVTVSENQKPITNPNPTTNNSNQNKIPEETNNPSASLKKKELNQDELDLIAKLKIGICRVVNKKDNSSSIGILCKIPFPDKNHLLSVLLTSNKVLSENMFKEGGELLIEGYQGFSKTLNLNLERKKFFNTEDYFTIIQILPDDGFDKDFLDSFLNIYEYKSDNKKEILKLETYAFYMESDLSVYCTPLKVEFVDIDRNNFTYELREEFSDFILLDKQTFTLIGFHDFNFRSCLGLLMENCVYEFQVDDEIKNGQKLSLEYVMLKGEKAIRIFGDKFVRNNQKLCKYKNFVRNEEFKEINTFYNCGTTYNENVKIIIELAGIKNVKNISHMFDGCDHLVVINNIEILNEIELTDISYMFNGCLYLTAIGDISNFKTDKVTNMEAFLSGCSQLTNLPDISKWNLDKVSSIANFFEKCCKLTSLRDISKWNISNAEKINGLFSHCFSLIEAPDISNWNISKIKILSDIFFDCRSLVSIPDISKWDIKNVTDIAALFGLCKTIKSLPDISNWNTKKVKDMSLLFLSCENLISLPDISKWDLSSVESISEMFSECK